MAATGSCCWPPRTLRAMRAAAAWCRRDGRAAPAGRACRPAAAGPRPTPRPGRRRPRADAGCKAMRLPEPGGPCVRMVLESSRLHWNDVMKMPSGLALSSALVRQGRSDLGREQAGPVLGGAASPLVVASSPAPLHLVGAGAAGEDRDDLDVDGLAAHVGEGIVRLGVLAELADRRPGDEAVGAGPVVADDDGIDALGPREVHPVGQEVAGLGGGRRVGPVRQLDAPRTAVFVDRHHIGCDVGVAGLVDEPAERQGRQAQRAEGGHAPVLGLDDGRADAVVPLLRRALIGAPGRRGAAAAVMGRRKALNIYRGPNWGQFWGSPRAGARVAAGMPGPAPSPRWRPSRPPHAPRFQPPPVGARARATVWAGEGCGG